MAPLFAVSDSLARIATHLCLAVLAVLAASALGVELRDGVERLR